MQEMTEKQAIEGQAAKTREADGQGAEEQGIGEQRIEEQGAEEQGIEEQGTEEQGIEEQRTGEQGAEEQKTEKQRTKGQTEKENLQKGQIIKESITGKAGLQEMQKQKEQESERAQMLRAEVFWEWFCSIPLLYHAQRELLLVCFDTPQAVYEASAEAFALLRARGCAWCAQVEAYRAYTPEEIRCEHRAAGIEFVSNCHPEYPERLRSLRDRPHGLFFRGRMPDPARTSVAVVGARVCTHYGRRLAEQLAEKTAQAGGQVISGAACGIDGAAQWAALEQGKGSWAVVGNGVDIRYPKTNALLLERLEQEGGVLSEFAPGTQPLRRHFPMRNRIISGLADVVAVVEARHQSGSLITADFALEQGRYVMAVPGRLDDELSRGCNELIAQGAGVILSAESFAEQIFPDFREQKRQKQLDIILAPSEKLVYSSLGLHSKSLWELMECTSLSPAELGGCLLSLEEKGLAGEVERNYYVKMK